MVSWLNTKSWLVGMILMACVPRGNAEITVRHIDGPSLSIDSATLTEHALQVETGEAPSPTDIPRETIITIDFDKDQTEQTEPNGSLLEFANGDRLLVEIVKVRDDLLHARALGQDINVPIGQLRGIDYNTSRDDHNWRPLLFREEGADDLVILANGDRSPGQFVGIDETNVSLRLAGRVLTIPIERAAAIAFSPELISAPETPGQRQIVHTPGGWLTVTELHGSTNDQFEGKTLFGANVAFQSAEIERIQFFGSRVVPLTDLEPANVEFTPWLDRQWSLRYHRSVTNHPLELNQQTYATGLGVHSRTRLAYSLNGEYERFFVTAGLVESAGARGSVLLAIEVDGRAIESREQVMRADGAIHFENIPLEGAETLNLLVDFGANGDIRDHANWCDPILIRPAEKGRKQSP